MTIFEYIILGFSILITIGWSLNIRHKVKYAQSREKSMELQAFMMTVSVVLVIAKFLTPLNLLWMIPASFILGLLSMGTPLKILWIFSSIYFSLWYIGIRNSGRKFYVNGQYEQAINAYKEEITKKPNSAESYFNLALAYGKLAQHNDEIAAYKEAIKLMPNNSLTHFNLGSAYIDVNDKEKAINSLKQAIILNPGYLKAQYTICKTYLEIGDKENALIQLEILKKMDKQSADELKKLIDAV